MERNKELDSEVKKGNADNLELAEKVTKKEE